MGFMCVLGDFWTDCVWTCRKLPLKKDRNHPLGTMNIHNGNPMCRSVDQVETLTRQNVRASTESWRISFWRRRMSKPTFMGTSWCDLLMFNIDLTGIERQICKSTPLPSLPPAVIFPHGSGEQRPLWEHGGQQPEAHQLEPETGM